MSVEKNQEAPIEDNNTTQETKKIPAIDKLAQFDVSLDDLIAKERK